MRAAHRLTLVLASWLVGSGCVYYNGIYNAQAEARLADAKLRRDDDGEATSRFQRSAAIAETVPGYAATVWYGLWGPKGLPAGIVSRWNTTVRRSLQLPDVKERLAGEGLAIADGPPQAFIDVVQRDVAKYREVVRAAKIDPVQ